MEAVIYARISRDREGREAGVDRQEADCRALAERLGWTVTRVFLENDTGASTRSRKSRPLYAEMLAGARSGAYQGILAYSTSRLTRRPRESEDLIELVERQGVQIRTVVSGDFDLSTADGRATARTLAAWDAAEAERTAERVQRAKAQAVAEGRYRGGPRPFGFDDDGVTVRDDEAAALLLVARGIIAGRSLNAMARELNDADMTTTTGKPLDGTNLRRLIQRPRNAGLIEERGAVVGRASWPAIVPEDLWWAAVATLADPSRRTSPGPERRWLGSGLYTCGTCGAGLFVHTSSSTGRKAYRCPVKAHVARSQEAVDEYVRAVVAGVLSRPDLATLLHEPDDGAGEALRGRQEALRARLAVFEADYSAGDINGRQLAEATARVQAELAAVEADLAARMRGTALGHLADGPDPGAGFLAATLDRQRAIVDALATVTIYPGRRGRPTGWRPGEPYVDLETVIVEPRHI